MTESNKKTSKRESPEPQDKFVIDFKVGPIISKVWFVEGREGTSFLKFTVHRLYKTKGSDNWKSPTNYFARNRQAVHEAIDLACEFLDQNAANPESAFDAAAAICAERESAKVNGSAAPAEPASSFAAS